MNDLKTKIAEAIDPAAWADMAKERQRYPADPPSRFMGTHNIQSALTRAQAALQAIHDAGYELTPRTATGIAIIERGMAAVEAFKAKYVVVPREPTEAMLWAGAKLTLPAMFRDGLHGLPTDGPSTRKQMGAVVAAVGKQYRAMLQASQPNTEET